MVEEAVCGDSPANGEEPDLEVQVEELCRELELINDRHLRLAAEFDNYRKRSQAQLMESGVRAQASLVGTLLDALDDLIHRVARLHHHHDSPWRLELANQFLGSMCTQYGFVLRPTGKKIIHLFSGAIVDGDREPMVGHVEH